MKLQKMDKSGKIGLFIAIIGVFLMLGLGLVSADISINPFDTRKSFEPSPTEDMSSFIIDDFNDDYGVIRLSTTIFWITSDKIAEYSLTSNTEYCLSSCEAQGKVTLFKDSKIFDDIKFTTLSGEETNIKGYEYDLFVGYKDVIVQVPIEWKEVCAKYDEKACWQEPIAWKDEIQKQEVWEAYDGSVLPAGDYRWKVKGVKEPWESIDFIPVVDSVEFSEWATWKESYSVGIISYYNFETTLGTDVVGGINNLTYSGANVNSGIVTGKIGYGLSCSSPDYAYKTTTTGFPSGDKSRTWAGWVSTTATEGCFFGIGTSGTTRAVQEMKRIANPTWQFANYGDDLNSWAGASGWEFIVMTYEEGSNLEKFYLNGINTINKSLAGSLVTGGSFDLCNCPRYSSVLTATVDEFAVWNRSLTSQEIYDLWNDGDGLSYTLDTNTYPSYFDYWDNNATLIDEGYALFNVTINNTNGTVILEINGTNYTAQNITANVYNVSVFLTSGAYPYYWGAWGNGTIEYYKISDIRYYFINDSKYPSFNNEWSNNKSLIDSGTAYFNISVIESNGTVILWLANSTTVNSYLASNSTAQDFRVAVALGYQNESVYYYNWSSYGTGALHNINYSSNYVYTINMSPKIHISYPLNVSIPFYEYGTNISVNWTYNGTKTNCNYYLGTSNGWCFQGSPTVATSCGGLDTGNVNIYGDDTYYNYTWANSAANNSYVTATSWDEIPANYSIPSSCWLNPLALRNRYDCGGFGSSINHLECRNLTGWVNIHDFSSPDLFCHNINLAVNMTWKMEPYNASFACSANTSSFNPQNYTSLVFTDSIETVYINWSYTVTARIINALAAAYETSSQSANVNITYPSGTVIVPSLEYNGTSYPSTGINYFTSNFTIPSLQSDSIATFPYRWTILYTNTTGTYQYNTTLRNQTVNPIKLYYCNSSDTIIAANFTAYDEANLSKINNWNFKATFDFWLGDGSAYRTVSINNISIAEVDLCTYPRNINYTVNGLSQFSDNAGEYTPRDYYLLKQNLNNITTNLSMMFIPNADSTTFIQKVQDNNQIIMPDVYIFTQRYYPELNEYKTVQVTKTGNDGKTVGFYKTETVFYRHILKTSDGDILLESPIQKIFAETAPYTIIFTVGSNPSYPGNSVEGLNNFTYSLSANATSKLVTYTYIDNSGLLINGSLVVEKLSLSGPNTIVCSTSSTDSTAVLICDLSAYTTGTFKIKAAVSRTDNSYKIVESINFKISDSKTIFGTFGLFLAIFIILVAACAFIYNPIAGIVAVDCAIVFVNIIGLASMGYTLIFSIIALSIIALILIVKSDSGYKI